MVQVREKDEWKFATMEYGGQCVTPAGMRWMLMWSVISLATEEEKRVRLWNTLTTFNFLGVSVCRFGNKGEPVWSWSGSSSLE